MTSNLKTIISGDFKFGMNIKWHNIYIFIYKGYVELFIVQLLFLIIHIEHHKKTAFWPFVMDFLQDENIETLIS